jgi:hypothetical protein
VELAMAFIVARAVTCRGGVGARTDGCSTSSELKSDTCRALKKPK